MHARNVDTEAITFIRKWVYLDAVFVYGNPLILIATSPMPTVSSHLFSICPILHDMIANSESGQ